MPHSCRRWVSTGKHACKCSSSRGLTVTEFTRHRWTRGQNRTGDQAPERLAHGHSTKTERPKANVRGVTIPRRSPLSGIQPTQTAHQLKAASRGQSEGTVLSWLEEMVPGPQHGLSLQAELETRQGALSSEHPCRAPGRPQAARDRPLSPAVQELSIGPKASGGIFSPGHLPGFGYVPISSLGIHTASEGVDLFYKRPNASSSCSFRAILLS